MSVNLGSDSSNDGNRGKGNPPECKMNGPVTSLSTLGDFISRVGFPVVAAGVLGYLLWSQTKELVSINTTLVNRNAIFEKLNQGQDTGHADLVRLDKDIDHL